MASCKLSALSLNNHTAIGESCKEQAAAAEEGVFALSTVFRFESVTDHEMVLRELDIEG